MLALFCTVILATGLYVTLNPRIQLGFITEACVAFATMNAGAYLVVRVLDGEQNYIALFYCIVAMLAGLIYHAFKVFYDVTPEKVRK